MALTIFLNNYRYFEHLTFSQKTNFLLFQTERDCRRQFKFEENGSKFIRQIGNTVGKGEIAFVHSMLFAMKVRMSEIKVNKIFEKKKKN